MAMLAPPPGRPAAKTSLSMPSLSSKIQRPTPLQRRATLKRSIDETSLMDILSSPSKRSRVTFDSDVEIVSADEDDQLDPLVVKEQVRRAIERHRVKDEEAYERVRAIFTAAPGSAAAPSLKTLKIHLQAVLANVTGLTKECAGLVNAILSSEWVGRDDAYYALFVRFLNNLTAAQRGYQNAVMRMLVDLLGPQKTRRLAGSKVVRQPTIHRRMLQALQHITTNVPSAPGALAERVASRLQYEFQKADERMTYIKNFMEMIKYVPDLASEILTYITRELIKLDVSIQADLDEEEEDAEEDILQHMSSSQTLVEHASQDMIMTPTNEEDDDEFSTSDESDMEDEEELDDQTLRRRKLKENVKQVDLIMDILFRHYTKLMSSGAQARHNAMEQLKAQFHSLILPTYRSRHPQFLIFHFAQTEAAIVDSFVTSCVHILVQKNQSQVIRHSAAAYFSGFVGRGAKVSPAVVKDCLDLLCEQLHVMRTTYEPTCRGPDLKRYGDFYAVFQAVLYIFCFRWRDIVLGSSTLDDDDESDMEDDAVESFHFSESLREALHAAIYSPLNPLRVCTPDIVEQFAKLTYALQLLYVFPKIEENKHVRVAATHWRGISDLNINQVDRDQSWMGDNGILEGYFPYDPYHLPISRHWIEDDYVEWKGIPGDQEEEDATTDDEIINEGEVDEDDERL